MGDLINFMTKTVPFSKELMEKISVKAMAELDKVGPDGVINALAFACTKIVFDEYIEGTTQLDIEETRRRLEHTKKVYQVMIETMEEELEHAIAEGL